MGIQFNNDVSNSVYLASGAAVPVGAWTLFASFVPFNNNVSKNLISIAQAGSGADYFLIQARSTGKLTLQIRRSSQNVIETTNDYDVGRWNYGIGYAESDGGAVTCVLNNGWGSTGTNGSSVSPNSVDRTGIGYIADSSPSTPMDGAIGAVGIWDTVLSRGEMTALMNGVPPWLIRPARLASCPLLDQFRPQLRDIGNQRLGYTALGTQNLQSYAGPPLQSLS